MKYQDLKKKNAAELDKLFAETNLELMRENAQVANGTVPKNPGKIKVLKKTLAKIIQIREEMNG
ncbi:MAG: 50S ribosomal protein L29 [Candidatus Woesearchaeota archaeon]